MIYLHIKTNTGNHWSTGFNGTYSNAVDYFLGRKTYREDFITGEEFCETITEVFEISRPDYEDNDNAR